MTCALPRRDFLKASLVAAVPVGANTQADALQPAEASRRLTAYQLGPHIWIRWDNTLLASYRAHPTQKYPYIYPLTGPITGLSVTTETSLPYPHHRSLLFACDRVNGGNFWQSDMSRGQIISAGPKLGRVTGTSAEISDACVWKMPGRSAVMKDEREIRVSVIDDDVRAIDVVIHWTAVVDVTVERTNHSLFAIRAAADIAPTGGGNLVNANGQAGEKATFGQKAGWCGYYGKRSRSGDAVEGVAIFDHPENPWSPCPWFTRDYGFISPTPFYFIDNPWKLAAGKSVQLRYRVVWHAGSSSEALLADRFRDWAAT